MMKEWTDRLPLREASEIRARERDRAREGRVGKIEAALLNPPADDGASNEFVAAMIYAATLRRKLMPNIAPADPAWMILITIAATPPGSPKASVTSICYGAGVPTPSALRHMATLIDDGLIERVRQADDRRKVFLHLTPKGRDLLNQMAEAWARRKLMILLVPSCVMLGMVLLDALMA